MIVSEFWSFLQLRLFPALSECLHSDLTEKQERLVAILEFLRVEQHINRPRHGGVGRPLLDRGPLFRAFIPKSFYQLPTTEDLHERLRTEPALRLICGFDERIPSLATFSRAFRSFAENGLGDLCHEALVRERIGNTPVLHSSRDSSAVPAREKPVKKDPKAAKASKHKRVTDEIYKLSAQEALARIPRACDVGRKPDSKGNLHTWIGYKVHVDWLDGMIPANVQTTSASTNDSLLAIPMMRQTAKRVPHIAYQLMDAGYDAPAIRTACHDLDQVPLIDSQKWRKSYVPFDPAQSRRFCERTNAERGFGRLKDEFGLCLARVRGHAKVHLHVMLAVLVLFADQMIKPIGS